MLINNTLSITLDEAINRSYREYLELRTYITRDDDDDKKEEDDQQHEPTEKQEGFFKRLWKSIKNFFSKIWNWIKRLFVGEEKKLDNAEDKVKEATTPENKAAATNILESIKFAKEQTRHCENVISANCAIIEKSDYEADVAGMVMADVAKVITPSIINSLFRKNNTHFVGAIKDGCNFFVNVKDKPELALEVAHQLKEVVDTYKEGTTKYQNDLMVLIDKLYKKLVSINGKKKDKDEYSKEMETVVDYIETIKQVVNKHKDARAIAKYIRKSNKEYDNNDVIIMPVGGWVTLVNRCKFYHELQDLAADEKDKKKWEDEHYFGSRDASKNIGKLKDKKYSDGTDGYDKLVAKGLDGNEAPMGVIDFIIIKIEKERKWFFFKSNKNIHLVHGNVTARLPYNKTLDYLEAEK